MSGTIDLRDWEAIREKVARLTPRYGRAKLGNHLYGYQEDGSVLIQYHGSDIARLHENGQVAFNFADWPTVTTVGHIQELLAHVQVERTHVPRDGNPYTFPTSYVSLGGNLWLGFAERNRRKNEPESVTMTMGCFPWEDKAKERTVTFTENELGEWHRITEFVPNWFELLKASEEAHMLRMREIERGLAHVQ
jgi:hypothetical protein